MTALERKRAEVELSKVDCAKGELELHIMQKESEIERIRETLIVQSTRIEELKALLSEGK